MKGPGDDRAYARAVASALARLLGHSMVLSPRDFALVAGWRAKGVPLGTVLEALEAASRRGSVRPRSALAHAAPAVEEAWQAIREARAPSFGTEGRIGTTLAAACERWRGALARTAAGTPLQELLTGLCERLDAGEDPARLDRELDRNLPGAAPDDLRSRAAEEVATRLAAVRSKIRPGAELPAIERATVDALRVRLDLPRLGLCDEALSR